jgi:hypothetical protein
MQALSEASRAERAAALEAKVRELLPRPRWTTDASIKRSCGWSSAARSPRSWRGLRSHVAQCREALADSGPSGRRLDFLAQELGREANTVGSKAASAALIHEVVALKGAIERLREQVQNVE